MTPEQIALLADELSQCIGKTVPDVLLLQAIAALREFENEKREWVKIERMD